MWCDAFICDVTHLCVTWRMHTWRDTFICDVTHSYVTWLIHMWHDSFICDVTHPYVMWLIRTWLSISASHELSISESRLAVKTLLLLPTADVLVRDSLSLPVTNFSSLNQGLPLRLCYCSDCRCVAVCCSIYKCCTECWSVLQCVVVCRRFVRSVEVCCGLSQCVVVCRIVRGGWCVGLCVAVDTLPGILSDEIQGCSCYRLQVWCSVLRHFAVCCGVLQYIAVCCSVLWRVAVCRSVSGCWRVAWRYWY